MRRNLAYFLVSIFALVGFTFPVGSFALVSTISPQQLVQFKNPNTLLPAYPTWAFGIAGGGTGTTTAPSNGFVFQGNPSGTFTQVNASQSLILASTQRKPTQNDAAPYPVGYSYWLNPDGTVYANMGSTTKGYAAWMPKALVGTTTVQLSGLLPCDIGTAVHCVGEATLRSGYTGPLIRVQRSSDGTSLDIYAATSTGILDTAARDKFCQDVPGEVCRIPIEYGQMPVDYNDTANEFYSTSTSANAAGAALNIASTTNIGRGFIIDATGTSTCPDYHVTATTSTTVSQRTYDGETNCHVDAGTGLLFGNAPRVNPMAKIGRVPGADLEAPYDIRYGSENGGYPYANRQGLAISYSLSFPMNNFTVLGTGSFYHTGGSAAVFSFPTTGFNTNGFKLEFDNFIYTGLGFQRNDGIWTASYRPISMGTNNPSMYMVSATSTAFGMVNEQVFTTANATYGVSATSTVAGGAWGRTDTSCAQPNAGQCYYGSQIIGPRVIYSAALTPVQQVQAKAAMIAVTGIYPQALDADILQCEGWGEPLNYESAGWANLFVYDHPEFRVRNICSGSTQATIDSNYSGWIGNQLNTTVANKILVLSINPNDVTTDRTIQEGHLSSIWTKAHASGFTQILVLEYPLSSGSWAGILGTNPNYNNDVSNWVNANAPSYVTPIDLRNIPQTKTYVIGDAISPDGFSFTPYGYGFFVPVIEAAITSKLVPVW